MKHFFTLLLLIGIITGINAQNIFFKEAESGFHVGGQFQSSNGTTLLGIIPGYTSNGKLTFGLGIGFEDFNGLLGSSTAVFPFISYLALKQDDSNPVSVAINGQYQYNTFSDLDLTANTISLGAGIYHQIAAGNNFDLIPGGGVGWGRLTLKDTTFGGSESSSGITYRLSLSGKFNKFYVTPNLLFSDGNSQFVLQLGIIFPK